MHSRQGVRDLPSSRAPSGLVGDFVFVWSPRLGMWASNAVPTGPRPRLGVRDYRATRVGGSRSNDLTFVYRYGNTTFMPDYAKLNVGSASNPMYLSGGVYWRNYTTGLAIVNPTSSSITVTIDGGDITYVDVNGMQYTQGTSVTLDPKSGLVLGVAGMICYPPTVRTSGLGPRT